MPDDGPFEYTLVQCSECGEVAVQMREYYHGRSDEDYSEGFDTDVPKIFYPARRRLSFAIPDPLRQEFEEAQTCFSAKAYTATAVMVRRILEGVCKENNVQERTLVKGLEKLRVQGLVDSAISEWADALRVLGNEGAHYTGRHVPRDDAEDALAFAEALLDHIYVLRKRFDKFAARRQKQAR
jgi:hypothetical protein